MLDGRQRGQAAVETALILPMLVFTLLGLIQLSLVYQARLTTEYAAFRAARSGSVYRGDCRRMYRDARLALVPTLPGNGGGTDVRSRYLAAARQMLGSNRTRVGTPLIIVSSYLYGGGDADRFDLQRFAGAATSCHCDNEPCPINPDAPSKIHVKVTYFYEYRVPFVNWIMTKYWLATVSGARWAERDPLMVMHDANRPPGIAGGPDTLASELIAAIDIQRGYYTTPVVATFKMLMMGPPLSNPPSCRAMERP